MNTVNRYVTYIRVSTKHQGKSGLGLEAQKQAALAYVANRGGECIAEFVEVESGKKNDREVIAAAIKRAKMSNAVLVIAKLDRLARNVFFISGLMESKVKFVACDMPEANELTIHIMAAMAEAEVKAISARTKAALAVKKQQLEEQGMKLGNPKLDEVRCTDPTAANAARTAKADEFAVQMSEYIEDIKCLGTTSLGGIARELNNRQILTARGKQWTPTAVKNIVARLNQ